MDDGSVVCAKCKHRFYQREHEHEYTVYFFVNDDVSIPVVVHAKDMEEAKSRAVDALDNMWASLKETPRILDAVQMEDEFKGENQLGNSYRSPESYARSNHYYRRCDRSTIYEPQYYLIDGVHRDGRPLKSFARKPLLKRRG